tara:strand:+ start:2828 stop:3346 length:519 start_codon:yes stop_codon:yes gene_type:complete
MNNDISTTAKKHYPILYAILNLLEFKGWTTIAEVASTSGKKRLEVVETLNRNKKNLRTGKDKVEVDKKTGKIKRILLATETADGAFEAGRVYRIVDINYGCAKAIRFFHGEKTPKLKALFEKHSEAYISGGIGDNFTHNEMLLTDENLKLVRDAGLVTPQQYDYYRGWTWDE